jgi:hypothetical protein
VTYARVKVAEFDAQASGFAAKDTETSVVADAAMAYHELTFAQDRVQAARERIRNAERLLVEASAMNRAGRLPATDVWEVENALDRYRAGLSEALQFELERGNRLRTMLMQIGSTSGLVRTVDPLPAVNDREMRAEDGVRTALDRRDDYRMLKASIDRENTQLGYSRNQALPRVDLLASYGLNGLEYSARQAFGYAQASKYPAWTLGVQMNFPSAATCRPRPTSRRPRSGWTRPGSGCGRSRFRSPTTSTRPVDAFAGARTLAAVEGSARAREAAARGREEPVPGAVAAIPARCCCARSGSSIPDSTSASSSSRSARAEVLLQAAQGVLLDQFR